MRLLEAGTATADDVAERIGPTRWHRPSMARHGAGTARPRRDHSPGRLRQSARPSRHASILAVWELADRAGALAWLARHPDFPDPEPATTTGRRARRPRSRRARRPSPLRCVNRVSSDRGARRVAADGLALPSRIQHGRTKEAHRYSTELRAGPHRRNLGECQARRRPEADPERRVSMPASSMASYSTPRGARRVTSSRSRCSTASTPAGASGMTSGSAKPQSRSPSATWASSA